MAEDKKEINTSKAQLSDEQKKYIHEQVDSFHKKMKVDKVRIPPEIEDVSLRWVKHAPFLSEFLLRFNYFMTEQIPTMGVNSTNGRINIYINPKFMRGGQMLPKMQWVDENNKPLKENKAGEPIDSNGHILNKKDVKQVPVFKKDKKGNIEIDPFGAPIFEEYESLPMTEQELEGVLVHEIEHLIRAHGERALDDHYVWNIAGDMLINDDITTMTIGNRKLELPKGAVYLAQAKADGYTGEPITEKLYFWLLDKKEEYRNKMQDLVKNQKGQSNESGSCPSCGGDGQEKDENGDSTGKPCPDCAGTGKQPGNGSGNGSPGDELFDAVYGSKIDDHSVLEESDSLAEQAIKEVIDTAKIRGWGNMSGSGVQRLEELCKGAKINWKTLLRKFLSASINSPGNIYENNWSKRNRRSLPLPGIKKLNNKILVGVDTSGSISDHEIKIFFSEIEKIVKDVGNLVIIQWDTKVTNVWKDYKRGDYKKIKVKGRGGTDVQDLFDYINKNKLNKFPLVNFTDGFFDTNIDYHKINTVWCITDEEVATNGKNNWGGNKILQGKKIFVDIKEYHK